MNNDKCPICNSEEIESILNRNCVPVFQNFVVRDKQNAIDMNKGKIELVFCKKCSFVYNRAFDPDLLSYCDEYDNTQTCSPLFNEYVKNLIEYLDKTIDIKNKTIVEVGSGNGEFLKAIVKRGAKAGYGYDPSYVGPETEYDGKVIFKKNYFDESCTNILADIVICRHVIEHIPNPLTLVKTIRKVLENSPNAVVFFETPCIEWIFRNKIIYDIFYEHCSYFSVNSLKYLFESSGFDINVLEHQFGGQYLWLIATVSSKSDFAILAKNYSNEVKRVKSDWQNRIMKYDSSEKVGIWGAGAKGVTFLNIIDPNREYIDCVIDLNPNKQGAYIPGTGHPIIDYRDIVDRGLTKIIVMNSNYFKEICNLVTNNNIDVEILNGEDLP